MSKKDSKKVDSELQPPEQDSFNFSAASNQRDRILAILKERPFTVLEGHRMGVMSPPARIMELKKILRKQGLGIAKRPAKNTTSTCVKNMVEYYLVKLSDEQGE